MMTPIESLASVLGFEDDLYDGRIAMAVQSKSGIDGFWTLELHQDYRTGCYLQSEIMWMFGEDCVVYFNDEQTRADVAYMKRISGCSCLQTDGEYPALWTQCKFERLSPGVLHFRGVHQFITNARESWEFLAEGVYDLLVHGEQPVWFNYATPVVRDPYRVLH